MGKRAKLGGGESSINAVVPQLPAVELSQPRDTPSVYDCPFEPNHRLFPIWSWWARLSKLLAHERLPTQRDRQAVVPGEAQQRSLKALSIAYPAIIRPIEKLAAQAERRYSASCKTATPKARQAYYDACESLAHELRRGMEAISGATVELIAAKPPAWTLRADLSVTNQRVDRPGESDQVGSLPWSGGRPPEAAGLPRPPDNDVRPLMPRGDTSEVADPSAYLAASEIISKYMEELPDLNHKRLLKILEENHSIKWYKPTKQRLCVHLADFDSVISRRQGAPDKFDHLDTYHDGIKTRIDEIRQRKAQRGEFGPRGK